MHDIQSLIDNLYADTQTSIMLFVPEAILCTVMVLLLLVRIIKITEKLDVFWVALVGAVAALVSTEFWHLLNSNPDPNEFARQELFTGMLVYDGFTVLLRAVLTGFMVLFLLFTRLTQVPDEAERADVYTLAFGATVGMCLMASANHMLTVFLAVEMASVPSYVLAGMLKGQRKSSEAALKYAVYGAGAAGVMLYGISLIAGVLNTLHLPTMAVELDGLFSTEPTGGVLMVLALGGLMLGVGLAFKLSAVPFHFWCPDVFEGASAEIAAFLSIASKAGALALLVRVAIGLGVAGPAELDEAVAVVEPAMPPAAAGLYALAEEEEEPPAPTNAATNVTPEDNDATPPEEPPSSDAAEDTATAEAVPPVATSGEQANAVTAAASNPVRNFIGQLVAFLAIITCTFGNLTAYGQNNAKRLLAYSTIAHAGYMMMAVPPILALADVDPAGAEAAVSGLAIYIIVYVFMNLTAFACVAFLHDQLGSDELADYAGLIHHNPKVVIILALTLFSLVGLPPLAGFIGKFAIFASVANGWTQTGQNYLMVLLLAGGLNTAISLFYYLRVAKIMTMEAAPESRTACHLGRLQLLFLAVLTVPTALLMLWWEPLKALADSAVASLSL
ncbi:MAG: NADH-quinone oxidoreductase subunit N [Planctomycetota bacterium]|nr:NADH-quinone oxidoreductase subunit N [Planctomycetota bacterium]